MPRRELLTEPQRLIFNAPASDERGMVRHYTLSAEDIALINRHRGDSNRLGFAVMLCYLRFPGRILQQGEQPPAALCIFVAEQLGLDPVHFGDYAERDQTRREHVLEIQTALGLRSLTSSMYREIAVWLLPTALATADGPTLVAAVLEELRARRIVCPPLPAIERLGGMVRARAQRQLPSSFVCPLHISLSRISIILAQLYGLPNNAIGHRPRMAKNSRSAPEHEKLPAQQAGRTFPPCTECSVVGILMQRGQCRDQCSLQKNARPAACSWEASSFQAYSDN